MFTYTHKNPGCRDISMMAELNEVAFINYHIIGTFVHISQFGRTPYAYRAYSSQYHFGTDIMNQMLRESLNSACYFTKINGRLSHFDAYYGKWLKSIPFYADFVKFVDPNLKITLKFHLYHEPNYQSEILLPESNKDLLFFLKDFSAIHIKNRKSASFDYDIFYSLSP
jgi:hypothetical protein